MSKQDREKLKKAKARKEQRIRKAKAEAKELAAKSTGVDRIHANETKPFNVNSVGQAVGAGPRMPRRTKKG